MKNDKGFTTVWVMVKQGDAPRRFSSRTIAKVRGIFEVFGRFRSDDSDRLYTVAEVHMVDPALQAQVAAAVAPSVIVDRSRRRFTIVHNKSPEAAPPN